MITSLWLAAVLLCFLMYVVLDGYDLGVGVGSLFEGNFEHRRHMLESVAVGWDANETWLILLGVGLWAGFPLAFGTVLPHAYLPLIVMLFGLIVRGVSLEMASQAPPAPVWTTAFGIASLVTALAQGFALGTLTSAMRIENGGFSGSSFGAFSWFCVLCAVTLTAAYAALGYAYIRAKSSGTLRAAVGRRGVAATLAAAVGLVGTLVAIGSTDIPLNLSSPGRAICFAGLLVFAACGATLALATFTRGPGSLDADYLPLAGLVVATVSVFLALAVARYPVIVPPDLTVDAAVGPHDTMVFLLVGIGLNMPLVLGYNVFAHRAFRGKFHVPADHAAPHPGSHAGSHVARRTGA